MTNLGKAEYGGVIRKTSKSKTTTHKFAKKRISRKSKKELNPAGVRKNIAQMVECEAAKMAKAVQAAKAAQKRRPLVRNGT